VTEQTRPKTTWYRVVSTRPISIDYQNGRATSLHYGCVFEADPNNKDVRRLSRLLPRPIVNLGPVPPADGSGIHMPGESSHMPANSSPKPKTTLPPGVADLVRSWER